MAFRSIFASRLPISAASCAGKRLPSTIRYNSSSSSSRAARVMEMAAQTEKPSAMEAAVPLMWAACGALAYTAWNRVDDKSGQQNVDKLIVI